MHMCTKLENGVLRNGQQPGSAVNSFIDLGEFEATKTLSGRRALCCDKHQFCAKLTVSSSLFLLSYSSSNTGHSVHRAGGIRGLSLWQHGYVERSGLITRLL